MTKLASNSLLAAALGHVERGFTVLTLKPRTKDPWTTDDRDRPQRYPVNAVNSATTDQETIHAWFEDCPDSNVGIAAGPDLVILDVDPRNGGDASLDALVADHEPLPETVTVITGNRGCHHYFRPLPGYVFRNASFAPGLELKTTGGYVVAPPSVHPDTGIEYFVDTKHDDTTFIDPPKIAPMPKWLADHIVAALQDDIVPEEMRVSEPSGAEERDWRYERCIAYLKKMPESLSGDNGHTALLRAARACAKFGLTHKQARDALNWFNKHKTGISPNADPDKHRATWTKREIRHKIADAYAYAKKRGEIGMLIRSMKWRPFPVSVFPEPCRTFVREAAAAMGCDPTYIALPLLAALAGCIGNTRRIQLKPGWCEPAVVWATTVGRSGTLKSPAQEIVLTALQKRESALIKQYKVELARYERDLDAWRDADRGTRGARPERPVARRFIVSDITVEAIAVRLDENARGLLLARDELGGWLRGFDKYRSGKGGDAQMWLEMQRAGHLLVDRKGSGKDGPAIISVPRAAVSICGGIQPAILRTALGREHFADGMAARLLMAKPPRKPKSWTDATVAKKTFDAIEDLFEHLLGIEFAVEKDGAKGPLDLPLTPAARRAFIRFYDRHARRQAATTSDDLAAAFSKLEGYAARFALIFDVVRHIYGKRPHTEIGVRSMRDGIRLADWFVHEEQRVYQALQEYEKAEKHRELTELILERGGRITVRDLMRARSKYRESSEDAREALQELVQAGLGHWEPRPPGPKGGHPTEEFVLKDGSVTVTAKEVLEFGPEQVEAQK